MQGQHTGTLGVVHPFGRSRCSCVALPTPIQQNPFKNRTTTIIKTRQQPYKNRPTTVKQPSNNRIKTVLQKPVQQPRKIPISKKPIQNPQPAPQDPRAALVPPLATLRYGAARAAGGLPEGPPLLLPHCQKSDPTPPEIGTGVRSGPSPIAPESLAASREAGAKPPGLREPPVLLRGGFKRALTLG